MYEPSDDVAARAPEHLPAHRERVRQFREEGELLLVGTFADVQADGSMSVFRSRDGAETFVAGDPFLLNGVISGYRILEWNEICGTGRQAMPRRSFTAITLHHPAPEHEQSMIQFMREVLEGLDGSQGLLDAHVARATDGSYLAAVTSWETAADFRKALPTIRGFAPRRDPAWTIAPDTPIRIEAV